MSDNNPFSQPVSVEDVPVLGFDPETGKVEGWEQVCIWAMRNSPVWSSAAKAANAADLDPNDVLKVICSQMLQQNVLLKERAYMEAMNSVEVADVPVEDARLSKWYFTYMDKQDCKEKLFETYAFNQAEAYRIFEAAIPSWNVSWVEHDSELVETEE